MTIVEVPKNVEMDYDFIAFSFNGYHSFEDFGIYRISNGKDYDYKLNPILIDKTAEDADRDGTYYFGSCHRNQVFNIKFAFDNTSESTLRRIKRWLNTDEVGTLWFAEAPHRVYSAKITGNSVVTCVAFAVDGERFYNGTGTIQFTSYEAYAKTPDVIVTPAGNKLSGNSHTSYVHFPNYERIKKALPLMVKQDKNEPEDSAFGDLSFYFKAHLLSPSDTEQITILADIVGDTYIIENATYIEKDGVYHIT